MPTRNDTITGAPCWIDLLTSDADRSRAFYGELFGWTSVQGGPETGGYVNFLKDGQPVAGAMANDGQSGAVDGWTVYLEVADAKATADAAAANGGVSYMDPMDVLDLGVMGMVADPGGASVGLWQPGTHRGFAVVAEPGAPAWFELHTRAYEASIEFYRTVFGWDAHVASDEPDFRYTTLGQGENQAAGVMDASAFRPENLPAEWSIYFGVEDTDAAVARVVELGGKVVEPAVDTPYGRLARVADPVGVHFKLVSLGG